MANNKFRQIFILVVLLSLNSCSYIFEPEEEEIIELNSQEKELIKNLGHFINSTQRMAELATTKASNEKVREYGSSMHDAYTAAQKEIRSLATSKNTVVPDTLDVFSQLNLNILTAIEGTHFDSAYLHQQIINFQEAKRLINNQKNQGNDQDLINYAKNSLSSISTQLTQAEQIWSIIRSGK